jgi:hypothetical protein
MRREGKGREMPSGSANMWSGTGCARADELDAAAEQVGTLARGEIRREWGGGEEIGDLRGGKSHRRGVED